MARSQTFEHSNETVRLTCVPNTWSQTDTSLPMTMDLHIGLQGPVFGEMLRSANVHIPTFEELEVMQSRHSLPDSSTTHSHSAMTIASSESPTPCKSGVPETVPRARTRSHLYDDPRPDGLSPGSGMKPSSLVPQSASPFLFRQLRPTWYTPPLSLVLQQGADVSCPENRPLRLPAGSPERRYHTVTLPVHATPRTPKATSNVRLGTSSSYHSAASSGISMPVPLPSRLAKRPAQDSLTAVSGRTSKRRNIGMGRLSHCIVCKSLTTTSDRF